MAATARIDTPVRARRAEPAEPLMIGEISDQTTGVIDMARRLGVGVHHEYDAVGTGKLWRAAPLVIVDVEAVRSVRRCRLPRRSGVILLVAEVTSEVWDAAAVLGASHVAVWPSCEPWLADRLAEIVS